MEFHILYSRRNFVDYDRFDFNVVIVALYHNGPFTPAIYSTIALCEPFIGGSKGRVRVPRPQIGPIYLIFMKFNFLVKGWLNNRLVGPLGI